MKRFIWLCLLAFSTAIAQVPPADVPGKQQAACGCCEQPGACGMPDCVPVTTSTPSAYTLEETNQTVREEAKSVAGLPRAAGRKFYSQFGSRMESAPLRRARPTLVVAASVPLFGEHCSWLI